MLTRLDVKCRNEFTGKAELTRGGVSSVAAAGEVGGNEGILNFKGEFAACTWLPVGSGTRRVLFCVFLLLFAYLRCASFFAIGSEFLGWFQNDTYSVVYFARFARRSQVTGRLFVQLVLKHARI